MSSPSTPVRRQRHLHAVGDRHTQRNHHHPAQCCRGASTVTVSGLGAVATIRVQPLSLTFRQSSSAPSLKAQSVEVVNDGNGPLTSTPSTSHPRPAAFLQAGGCVSGSVVAAGSSCTVQIPGGPRRRSISGQLVIAHSAGGATSTSPCLVRRWRTCNKHVSWWSTATYLLTTTSLPPETQTRVSLMRLQAGNALDSVFRFSSGKQPVASGFHVITSIRLRVVAHAVATSIPWFKTRRPR